MCEYECRCPGCQKQSERLDHIADHMSAVVELLYGTTKLSKEDLEWHLDEVCHSLGIKLPINMPNIERTTATSDLFDFALSYTRELTKAI